MTNLEERNIEHAILMKELEWGVNTETNTVYMAYDFDMDNLYTIVTKIDNLLRKHYRYSGLHCTQDEFFGCLDMTFER